jgi:hypothetical protein
MKYVSKNGEYINLNLDECKRLKENMKIIEHRKGPKVFIGSLDCSL